MTDSPQRLDRIEHTVREYIVRLETGSPPVTGRFLVGFTAFLLGVVCTSTGLLTFVIFLPIYLLDVLYPNRWCKSLGRLPVVVTGIGVALLGYAAVCVLGTNRSLGERSTPSTRERSNEPETRDTDITFYPFRDEDEPSYPHFSHSRTRGQGSAPSDPQDGIRFDSIPEFHRWYRNRDAESNEWRCVECDAIVESPRRPRNCPRCGRDDEDLPTGVLLFTSKTN